jgi:hypothetical protein
MGCLPLERTTNFMEQNGCVARFNNIALEFNDKLKNITTKLNQELPGMKLLFSNPYYIMLHIIKKPEEYGMLPQQIISLYITNMKHINN